MIGRIVSTKMQKTVVVVVERQRVHPLYKKVFMRSKKFLVDDLLGVKEGDMVEFVKVRPISKNKHFRIVKVVGKNLQEIMEEKLKMEAKEVISEVMPASPEGSQGGPEEKESEQGTVDSEQSEEKTKRPIKRIRKGEKK